MIPDPEGHEYNFIDGRVMDSNCVQQADQVLKRSRAYDKIQKA